jgi:predicted PurR-regulated permease PerM
VAKVTAAPGWQRALVVLTGTVVGVVVVSCLYWAQVVFIPLALAVFLAFLLNPLVRAFQRRGLGRVSSVIVVVLLAALLLGGLGSLVTWQVAGLVSKLPDYTTNIQKKIQSLRKVGAGSERLEKMIEEVAAAWTSKPPVKEDALNKSPGVPASLPRQPSTVVMQPESVPWLGRLPGYLGSAVEALGGLALALVLVVFMLLKREDLRNRFLRLVGHGRMSSTTKAVDDAGQRISRYLLMQLVINGGCGLALTIGLFLIGVPHALLWGFLAAVLRYVPYLGVCITSLLLLTLSLAMFPGWVHPLLVLGLIVVVELVAYHVMEPWLFSQSLGISAVALLVSAAFCAFLWGPVGLVLSAPLTVVLLVLGKYVPQLEFLDVLLGDEPALDPDVTYYQRLLARDQDDAAQLVLAQAKTLPPEQVYDGLLVPALNYVKRDRARDDMTEADEQFVLRATREIVEDLGERQAAAAGKASALAEKQSEAPARRKVRILGCPGHDEADALALEMLRQLLDPARWEVEVLSIEMLSAELVALAGDKEPAVVCIGALPPGGLAHTRYLCKRLRARLPEARIVVGRWGLKGNVEENQELLREAGADQVETTLLETRTHLHAWLPVLAQEEAKTTAGAARERRMVAV